MRTAPYVVCMWLASAVALTATAAEKPEPMAIVVSVRGSPVVKRSGATLSATTGMTLLDQDEIACPKGAQVVCYCCDAKKLVVSGGESLRLRAGKGQQRAARSSRWHALLMVLRRTFADPAFAEIASAAVRGGPRNIGDDMRLVHPTAFISDAGDYQLGSVAAKHPVFVFTVADDSKPIHLRIYEDGRLVTDHAIAADEVSRGASPASLWIVRPRLDPLPVGNLKWQVTAGDANRRSPLRPFRVEEREADANPAPATEENPLVVGAAHEAAHHYGEALAAYQRAVRAAPTDPVPHQVLARLYDVLNHPDLCNHELRLALQAAKRGESP